MTATENALLAAVCANPGDDNARLVYADWLQEHGQEERAEFIRVQCESFNAGYPGGLTIRIARLHAAGGSKADHPAVDRAARLLSEFSTAWCQDMGTDAATAYEWNWVRGFVSEVTCPAAVWLEHGDAIRKAQPVTTVRLTTRPGSPMGWEGFVHRGDHTESYYTHDKFPGVTFELPEVPYGALNFMTRANGVANPDAELHIGLSDGPADS